MKNNKKDTNSGARKALAWIPYILIPVLIISGVSLYARQQKKEKLEYYQVVQYFDDKKVTEYDLNMSSGALEFKLKGDNKVYTYTVPNVSMFQEDIHNGVIAYNRAHPDAPIKAQYETGSTGALLLNIVPTLLMLVSALVGRQRILEAYRHAVESRYRFFSYGDACFLERDPEAAHSID